MSRVRTTRGRRFQEQRLMATAVAAGTAFGWAEGHRDNKDVIAEWRGRRLMAMALSAVVATPLLAAVAVAVIG